MSDEAQLWADVVWRALADGCAPAEHAPHTQLKARIPTSGGSDLTSIEARQAWIFLTSLHGEWAESRRDICLACGVDPEILRKEALKRGPSRLARVGLMELEDAPTRKTTPCVAAMLLDYAAGMPMDEMVEKHGITARQCMVNAAYHKVKRPKHVAHPFKRKTTSEGASA